MKDLIREHDSSLSNFRPWLGFFPPCSFYYNILKYVCCDLVNKRRNLAGSASSLFQAAPALSIPVAVTTVAQMIGDLHEGAG